MTGVQTCALPIIKNGDITNDEVEAARQFSSERAFDVAWFPGIHIEEIGRASCRERV